MTTAYKDTPALIADLEEHIAICWRLMQKYRRLGQRSMARSFRFQLLEYLRQRAVGQGRITTWL